MQHSARLKVFKRTKDMFYCTWAVPTPDGRYQATFLHTAKITSDGGIRFDWQRPDETKGHTTVLNDGIRSPADVARYMMVTTSLDHIPPFGGVRQYTESFSSGNKEHESAATPDTQDGEFIFDGEITFPLVGADTDAVFGMFFLEYAQAGKLELIPSPED